MPPAFALSQDQTLRFISLSPARTGIQNPYARLNISSIHPEYVHASDPNNPPHSHAGTKTKRRLRIPSSPDKIFKDQLAPASLPSSGEARLIGAAFPGVKAMTTHRRNPPDPRKPQQFPGLTPSFHRLVQTRAQRMRDMHWAICGCAGQSLHEQISASNDTAPYGARPNPWRSACENLFLLLH